MSEVNIIGNDELVAVTNLTSHRVGYVLDSGVRRRFAPHVTMNLTAGELRELSYRPGGSTMLTDFLRVEDADLAAEFGVSEDTVEYNWNEDDIVAALTGDDLDVLLDALDFAPQGIVQEIVAKAIELEIPDERKRTAIMKKTGADISAMIKNKHAYDEETNQDENVETKTRRTTAKKSTSNTTRRKSTSTKKTAAKKTTTAKQEAVKEETTAKETTPAKETVATEE